MFMKPGRFKAFKAPHIFMLFDQILDSNPVPSTYEVNSLSFALLDLKSIEHLKVDRLLPEFAIQIYLYLVLDVAK